MSTTSIHEKAPARNGRRPRTTAEAVAAPRRSEATPAPALNTLSGMETMVNRYAGMAHNGSAALGEGFAYSRELMQSANAYLAAAMELGQALAAASTPQQIMEATTAHARRQLELLTEQNRHLWMAAQRVVHMSVDGAGNGDAR